MIKQKYFVGFSIIILLIIAFLTGFASFFPMNDTLIFVSSIPYIALWMIIFILLISYIFLVKSNISRKISYIIDHFPFVLLMWSIALTLFTTSRIEFRIHENEAVPLSRIFENIGLSYKTDTSMTFTDFETESYTRKNKTMHHYRASLGFSDNTVKTIEVNKPLKIKNITLYFKGWSKVINRFNFSINNERYNIFEQSGNPINLDEKKQFLLRPLDVNNEGDIMFEYIITEDVNIIANSIFTEKNYTEDDILKEINFTVTDSSYGHTLELIAVHSPLKILLAITAIIFMIILAYSLFIKSSGKYPVHTQ